MSPEYAMEGLFSEKSDVFSFGVLMLEIVSGRRNTSFYEDVESLTLLGYVSSSSFQKKRFYLMRLKFKNWCMLMFSGLEFMDWRQRYMSIRSTYIWYMFPKWYFEMHTHKFIVCARTCTRQAYYGHSNFNAQ